LSVLNKLSGKADLVVFPELSLIGYPPEDLILREKIHLETLKYLKDEDEAIKLYTDSNYLRQGITDWIHKWKLNNWRTAAKKPVANRDLWIEISDLNEKMNVEWNWVKGHAGDPGNERADQLANMGAENV